MSFVDCDTCVERDVAAFQYLDQSRKRLAKVLDERSHVLDLICHSRNSIRHDHLLKSQLMSPEQSRPNTTAAAGMMTPKGDHVKINVRTSFYFLVYRERISASELFGKYISEFGIDAFRTILLWKCVLSRLA